MREALSAIAGALMVVGFIPYIISVLRKEVKPSKATWIIWASLDSIAFAGMVVKGTANGQILGAISGSLIIIILSFKYGTPGWTKVDKFCFTGAVLGISFWALFSSPSLGILISLTVGFLGSIPTFVETWKHPELESKSAWLIFWVSCLFATAAIPRWTIADVAQPVSFLMIESTMMFLLFIRPRM